MREEMIRALVLELTEALSGIRPPVPPDELREMHRKKDFSGMMRYIRNTLHLDIKIRIGFVNNGGPDKAPAWIDSPYPMPLYGTPE